MRDDVRKIYEENKDIYFGLLVPQDNENQPRVHYVYEWFIVESNKVFYVGKGTRNRYKHILKEIETFENNPRKYKGEKYKLLKDEFTIDCRFIMEDLTDEESQIMESFFIVQRLLDNQPLLQHIIPWESGGLTEDHYNRWLDVNYCKDEREFLDFFR